MKKTIITTILLLMIVINQGQAQSYYDQIAQPDSVFSVYVEQDTTNYYSVYLVFENISNDSILLISNFRNFTEQIEPGPGFRIKFFLNHNQIMPNRGELPIDSYTYFEGRTHVAPFSIIKYPVALPYVGVLRNDVEYGLVFEVNYRYFNFDKREGGNYRVKTDYYKLDYLKTE